MSGGAGAPELELKAVVTDAAALAARLEQAGKQTFRGRMTDRRYDRPDRSLLARDEVLRVRAFAPAGRGAARAELTWKGPTKRTNGYKEREEIQFAVDDPDATASVLERLGFEVSDAIDRCVEYYELGKASVRIEWYPRMDVLVEVEGAPAEIEKAVAGTGIPRPDFTAERLLDFAGRYRQRMGRDAVLRLDGLRANERPGFPEWAT